MSVDEFYEEDEHEGIEYQIGQDGTAIVSRNKMTLDDVAKAEERDDPFSNVGQTDDDLLD
ncbi:hypothetical protein [Peribacillus muralis]|uniref:hypothetical protein n=1 Tax=Peribacillus muralis TaxID=264697 RepID=UPI003D06B75F